MYVKIKWKMFRNLRMWEQHKHRTERLLSEAMTVSGM